MSGSDKYLKNARTRAHIFFILTKYIYLHVKIIIQKGRPDNYLAEINVLRTGMIFFWKGVSDKYIYSFILSLFKIINIIKLQLKI